MTSSWTGSDRVIHGLAVTLMIGTLALLYMGGLVTTHEVGMAVPDWPSTFQENMFTYYFFDKSFGIQLEHTHRLAGSVIGLITIGLGLSIARWETRVWVRWLALATFVGVCFQGFLGGARVVLNAILGQHLAMIHGCCAQAFFALTVVMVAVTSRWWREGQALVHEEAVTVQRLTLILSIAVYAQMVLGAIVRHYEGLLWIVHLALGSIIFFGSLYLMMLSLLHRPIRRAIGSAVVLLGGGLAAQIVLGLVALFVTGILESTPHTQITTQEAFTVTTHLALGSILLGVSVYLALASRRLLVPEGASAGSAASTKILEPVA